MKPLRILPLVAITVGAVGITACADHPVEPSAESSLSTEGLAASFALDGRSAETTGNHIVAFTGNTIPARFADQISRMGGAVERSLDPIGVAVVSGLDDDAVAELNRMRGVQSVEPDIIIDFEGPESVEGAGFLHAAELAPSSTDDPSQAFFFPRQWHHRAIQADDAWAAGFLGSSDVVVSIIDTGIDYNHANLEGLVDLDRSISLHPWDDALLAEHFPGAHPIADLNRHGTHVASTVSSTAANAAGVTSKTTLFGVKVCGAFVGCPRSATLEAIMYSADQGADVINMSLGGYFLRSEDRGNWLPLVIRATNYAHQHGALVVVSAGNDGEDLDRNRDEFKLYCTNPNVVCVSATGPTWRETIDGPWDDFDQPAVFTNYGRSSIDVAAPGGNTNNFVYAACSSFSLRTTGCQASNRFVIGLRGTSMAAPHATGVAALIAAHVDGTQGNPARIRNILHQTADKVGDSAHDPYFGRGRVNAFNAVTEGASGRGSQVQDRGQGQARDRM